MARIKTARQVAASRRNIKKAILASARKRKRSFQSVDAKRLRRKSAKIHSRQRTTYRGGITYTTQKSRGLTKNRGSYRTSAYKGKTLLGYGYSTFNKKGALVEDLYVSKGYRGTGVSRQILLHQAHALKGKRVKVTGLRSIGGDKTLARQKIRGVKAVSQKHSKASSDYVSGLMETSWAIQSSGHTGQMRRRAKMNKKLARYGRMGL